MPPSSLASDAEWGSSQTQSTQPTQPLSSQDTQRSLQVPSTSSLHGIHRMQHLRPIRLVALTKPQRPFQMRLAFILGALCAFGPISLDLYLPSLPSLSRSLEISASLTQLTLSACLLGLALGQVIAGPISDASGRRRPLLAGLVIYALASFLCVVAPSALVLIALRFIQGLAGATGIVIARSMARDMYAGTVAARFFSLLTVVYGIAPILAPLFGGVLLHFTDWRGVFLALTIISLLLLIATIIGTDETLPVDERQTGGIRATFTTFRHLLTDRFLVAYALSCGLAYSAMFVYISGSSFLLQDTYRLSPQIFSIIFSINALGLMLGGRTSGWLVVHIPPIRLLTAGLIATATGGLMLVFSAISGVGLVGILPSLFVIVSSIGLVLPNATALILAGRPRVAGSAAALLGVLQYSIGAAAVPLVGIFGNRTIPMSVVIAVLGISALLVFALPGRRRATPQYN
jgi:DHA1 family bicyclomycin/chloramphenicol resistance-like MFS transporter